MSTEADERGLTRGTCFVVCRLELAAVAAPLCFWWYFFIAAGFCRFFFFPFFCASNAHGLRHVSVSFASFASLLIVAGCAQASVTYLIGLSGCCVLSVGGLYH